MKIGVIGGVSSTAILLNKLKQYGFDNIKVWSYQPKVTTNVSGWYDLKSLSNELGFECNLFIQVHKCYEEINEFQPDIIFIVGLSQLIPSKILEIPKLGCVGFHPTALPQGRGRAPIAWLILEKADGATTFFFLREGVDDGPIIVQQPFTINELDDASSVERKILEAEQLALDKLLPMLKEGSLPSTEQNSDKATWFGRRTPDDGLINWNDSTDIILSLIKASTTPHPGAFTYQDNKLIKILKATKTNTPIRGVIGRIVEVNENDFTIQCGDGLLRIISWYAEDWTPRVGILLGYYVESEIYKLKAYVSALEARLDCLESKLKRI